MEWKIFENPVDYPQALADMEARVEAILADRASEAVWLLEHPPLYTAGTSAKNADLKLTNFPVYKTGRGGQWTYHGPGQRIAYVMLDLKKRNAADVRHYVKNLEHWIIASLKHFGVKGFTREGRIGVWVTPHDSLRSSAPPQGGSKEEKIAALGIRVRKWVTFHGIALNVNPDLSHYAGIVPCGLSEYGVTSLHQLGVRATMEEVDEILKKEFEKIF